MLTVTRMGGGTKGNWRFVVQAVSIFGILLLFSHQLMTLMRLGTTNYNSSAIFLSHLNYEPIRQSVNEPSILDVSHEKPKYLLYFSQSGFANQLICLRNAYFMAKALNRTLLLPPILPHFGAGSTLNTNVLSKNKMRFKVRAGLEQTKMNPFFYFLRRLPIDKYMPLESVIDIPFSIPDIVSVDVKEFIIDVTDKSSAFQNQDLYRPGNMSQHTLETDIGYSHFNTHWVHQRPDLDGFNETVYVKQYNRDYVHQLVYRDIYRIQYPGYNESIKKEKSHGNEQLMLDTDILVFLDAFHPSYHESMYDQESARTKIMAPQTGINSFQVQFADPIRMEAKHIIQNWTKTKALLLSSLTSVTEAILSEKQRVASYADSSNFDYVAIHLRTGDGSFSKPDNIQMAIIENINRVRQTIADWIIQQTSNTDSYYEKDQFDKENLRNIPRVIGLYVATDLLDFQTHPIFKSEIDSLQMDLYKKYHLNLTIKSKKDIQSSIDRLSSQHGILYADIFMDMQMAICANIGFVGTTGSSFTIQIQKQRTFVPR